MSIAAIETSYAGCRFRSRLEARWATFFDALGIEWEHEPEGYETSAGRYLPDFRITVPSDSEPYFFEVKPEGARHDRRHAALAAESGCPVIVARGMPRSYRDQKRGEASALWVYGVERTELVDDKVQVVEGAVGSPAAFVGRLQGVVAADEFFPGAFIETYNLIHKGRTWYLDSWNDVHIALYASGLYPPTDCPDIDRAYTAARSARFGA